MSTGLSRVVRRRRKPIVTPLHAQTDAGEAQESPPRLVMDYAIGLLVDEAEMPVGSERWRASERAYWSKHG